MPKTPPVSPKAPAPRPQPFGQADADLTARIDALQNAVKPKRPKPPPIGGMF